MGDDDPFGSYGLGPIRLEDKDVFDRLFATCRTRLSDYSFANTFIWRHSIHLRWRLLHECLCVFANGDGGLTMLFPPLGGGDAVAALRESMAICGDYNAASRYAGMRRIEYVSDEQRGLLAGAGMTAEPMSGDYIYATARMIDLAGGDLASKRQARNRFARRYAARTEPLRPEHLPACMDLLNRWRAQTDADAGPGLLVRFKRAKEVEATAEALAHAPAIGLAGMVLFADERLVGLTLGERLTSDTCSIVVEKTDRDYVGSANYIFSEFCRQYWADTTWCNVGDDWEVPSLAWTKNSYRPATRLAKWVLRPVSAVAAVVEGLRAAPAAVAEIVTAGEVPSPPAGEEAPALPSRAELADLDALMALESRCFPKPLALTRRQLRHLLRSPCASTHVLRKDGRIVADALLLRRRTRQGILGRLYSLAVDEKFRGKGFGRALLANCLDVLRAEGVGAVVLEVDVRNHSAIGLYESAGFTKDRLLRDYYGPGLDGWKMRLALAAAPSVAATAQPRRADEVPPA